MSYMAENLKVLLWKNKGELSNKTYSEYIDYVAKQCHMTAEHFREILMDKVVATSEQERSLRSFFEDYGYDLSAIRYDFLFEDLMKASRNELLDKNLRFLLKSIEWGDNAEFVEAIGVNPSTLTRWKQGPTKPDRVSQLRICKYFGYLDTEVLTSKYLFLELEPVSVQQRKQQCKKLIDNMSKEEFEQIYPAIRKLLN